MLAVSEREGQTQFDFMRLLETIIGDSRIGDNSESYLDVKTRLGEAVLGSMDFASLGERVSEILLGMRQSGGEAKKSQEAVVAEMEQYLIDNYEKPISNEMLANKFGFVPNYISKIFRRHRGVTPSEFLTKYRVEMAIRLMKVHPDMLIKEIAQAVGYANQYYFSRIFKKETGMWPTEYPGRDAGEDG
ncbi:MAG: helix-turn-helix transcriptional regulator [Anaerotruncus massiliensis (ex Togo et al. 2019)]